jgi:hypothetical protein
VRNRKELNASLKGTTLGDGDGDTDDALKWIKRAKKREKELAKKRQEEMDNMDKAAQDEYTESELQTFFALELLLINFLRQRILSVSRSATTLKKWTKATLAYSP